MQHPRGEEIELVGLAIVNNGVPGITASVVSTHKVRTLRQNVHQFPLALVTPLGYGLIFVEEYQLAIIYT